MNNPQLSEHEIDFDQWMTLAHKDPAAFEIMRRHCIEDFIESAPEEKCRRLRGLQWQIDQTRNLARTPMAACIAISNMMWDSLYQLNQRQQELTSIPSKQCPDRPLATMGATVLPFHARHP